MREEGYFTPEAVLRERRLFTLDVG